MLVAQGLDAMSINIKGDAEAVKKFCSADMNIVWRNAIWAKEHGVWVEIVTLVISGADDAVNGLTRIARRIKKELGNDTPWHVIGYYLAYKFSTESYVPPTLAGTLEKARDMGIDEGLKYVYIGNVSGHPYENTYCPKYKQLLISRCGFSIIRYNIGTDKRCPYCGERIPIIGEPNIPDNDSAKWIKI